MEKTREDEALVPHALTAEEVALKLNADLERGLTEEEASRRLEKYGPNVIRAKEVRFKALRIFLAEFANPFIIMLLIAAVVSYALSEMVDALTIFAIVILCAVLGFTQEYKAEKAVEALRKLTAPRAKVLRNGSVKEIPAEKVVVGDVLVLEEGDKVAADARLFECYSLETNEASLTGESRPAKKLLDPVDPSAPIPERRNMVFMGTYVVRGKGKAVVTATGMDTEFGKIAHLVQELGEEKTPLEVKLEKFAFKLGLIISVLCVAIFFLELLRWGFVMKVMVLSFEAAVALAVAAVPEALPAVIVATLAIGARELAKRGAIVRRLASSETMGSVTFVCADKTGTLTKGEMEVERIYANGRILSLVEVEIADEPTKEACLKTLLIGALCNDASLTEEGGVGDPTEVALLRSAQQFSISREEFPRVHEIPFSPERKMMTTVHKMPDRKLLVAVKGAPEVVLSRSKWAYFEGKVSPLTRGMREKVLKVNDELASEGLRVLAMAYKEIPEGSPLEEDVLERDLIFVGMQAMRDPPRPEAVEAVKLCKRAGIRSVMITGDHKLTAVAIAKELGIFKQGDLVLTGEDLERMSDEELESVVEKVTVYARVSPYHKLKIVEALKRRGHIVAMTGDGVNDAPALKKADIGVAMGIKGTDVSKEASDMILTDDNYATLISALIWGRAIFDDIRKYIRYLIACNIGEVIVIGSAVLAGLPLPLLPTQILWLNLVTDGPPAIALSFDPPEKDIADRPPRDPKAGIFHGMEKFVLVSTLIQVLTTLGVFLYGYFFLGDYKLATTLAFLQLALFELFVVWNCRSERRCVWRMGREAFANKIFVASTISMIALMLAIPYIPGLNVALHCSPLSFRDYALVLGTASTGLFFVLPELWMKRE